MDMIKTIEYIVATLIVIYVCGISVVWIYEIREFKLYREAQRHMHMLEMCGLSMAVLHAKEFKIRQDYRRDSELLDRKRRFILENLLMIRRSSLKMEKKADMC
jgi:hypothetical protein